MAIQIGDLVIAGVFFNTSRFSVHGQLLLRSDEQPVHVELTGMPESDLRDRAFEFEVPDNDYPATEEERQRVGRLRGRQIGAVGGLTTLPRAGTQAETPAARGFYFEWFGQSGRVVLALENVVLRFIENPPRRKLSSLDIEKIAGEVSAGTPFSPEPALPDEAGGLETEPDMEADEMVPIDEANREGFALISDELNQELERFAHQVDLEIASGSEEGAEAIEECELLDDLPENGVGTPIPSLLQRLNLPRPDPSLTECEAQTAFIRVLAELALHGIAFDVCEHCSVRDAYRLLIDEVCPEGTYFPEMDGSSFVQHFSTSDFCEKCQNEF